MKSTQIFKLYISNFLTGLVFWYGIEKLFMGHIGINAIGIGAASAFLTIILVLFDIPAGIMADKWSRKYVLAISALTLAFSSLIGGVSNGLGAYLVCELFYGLYVVTSSGTYQSIIYDSLREEKREHDYSRINGRIYASFMIGAGVGNVLSGFIAHKFGFRASYFLTIIPSALNVLVAYSLHEPRFHETAHQERIIHQLGKALKSISRINLVRGLTIVMTLFAIIELFKLEFGQLYMFRYTTAAQTVGILWAVYAFAMALGSVIAHKFRARLDVLIVLSVLPLIVMSFIDKPLSLGLFILQAVAAAALLNQIETRIQESTPSGVRTSVLSVVSTLGRIVVVPSSFLLGWIFRDYDALAALRFVTIVATVALIFWVIASSRMRGANKPITADENIVVLEGPGGAI